MDRWLSNKAHANGLAETDVRDMDNHRCKELVRLIAQGRRRPEKAIFPLIPPITFAPRSPSGSATFPLCEVLSGLPASLRQAGVYDFPLSTLP